VSDEKKGSGTVDVWKKLAGEVIVVDTNSSFIYTGKLESVDDRFITMADADVHDMSDSTVTKEIYALETMKYGVRSNRKRVHVMIAHIVSVSRLEDVVKY
jgi:hypothetical protein